MASRLVLKRRIERLKKPKIFLLRFYIRVVEDSTIDQKYIVLHIQMPLSNFGELPHFEKVQK